MKKILSLVLALCMVMSLAACDQKADGDQSNTDNEVEENTPIKLRFAELNAENSNAGKMDKRVMELCEAADVGLSFDFYPNGSLVSQDMEAVQAGLCDIMMMTFSTASSIYAPMGAFDAPYIITDVEQAEKVFDYESAASTKLNENLVPLGVRFLGSYYAGNRNTSTTNKPIYSVDDMKGLKIRVVNGDLWISLFRAFGAEPTPMAMSEVSSALVTGVCEAQENPYSSFVTNKMYEIQDYAIETGHMPANYPYFINEATFNKLSKAQQEVLINAVQQAANETTERLHDQMEEDKQLCIDNGMTVIGVEDGLDLDSFKEAAMSVYDEYLDAWGDMPDTIRSCYE